MEGADPAQSQDADTHEIAPKASEGVPAGEGERERRREEESEEEGSLGRKGSPGSPRRKGSPGRGRGRGSVESAEDDLVPVDDRARDHPLRSESRKTTKSAISSTWPSLPIGWVFAAFSRQSSPAPWKVRWISSSPSVSVQPMLRPLIRTRSQRCAWAALRVRPMSPDLAATYGARKDCPPCAEDVMMLTTVPGAPRSTRCWTAACIAKNGARRLIAMCASNSSGVVSRSVPRDVSPAAFTRQSIRPWAATTCSTLPRACAGSVRSACTNVAPVRAANFSPSSVRRPVKATVAPSRSAARTMPAPTPWLPPLTRTTLSSSSWFMGVLPSFSVPATATATGTSTTSGAVTFLPVS